MTGRPPDPGWPEAVKALPVCPRRQLPIPYIAEIAPDGAGNFTILDHDRERECLTGRLCAMCGQPMHAEVTFLGDPASLTPGAFWIEPPVHERCAETAAAGLCPFVSGQRVPRRPAAADVPLVGFTPARITEVGRTIPKRPWVMAITRDYSTALYPAHDGSLVTVYQARQIDRVRRFAYGPDGRLAEATPPEPTTPPASPGPRNQPRRTTRANRRT